MADRLINLILTSIQSLVLMIISTLIIFVLWAINTGSTDSYIIVRLYITFVVCTVAIWAIKREKVVISVEQRS